MQPVHLAQVASNTNWLGALGAYKVYVLLFAGCAAASALATPLYILLAQRWGWVDRPGGRKRHDHATATMGGLVVFAVVFVGAALAMKLDAPAAEALRRKLPHLLGLSVCTLCMVLLGIVDDRHAVAARVKLLVQTVVAIAAVSLGFRVEAVTLPLLDSVTLPAAVGAVLSILWIVGITNAINLTDGLDGLAAGICLLASGVNAVVALWLGNLDMAVLMVVLAGALAGFLRWNFHPARVFLGDTGSLGLGMFLALASLHSAQKSPTVVLILVPLFALGYPIFDTLLAVARRTLRGQPLFASDRDHIHHRLLARGQSPSRATLQIYFASILVSIACLVSLAANHLVLGLLLVGVMAMALFSARVLGYLEWGGWQARWLGRQDTRLLHAASQLARLKIERAATPAEWVRALAPVASEIGCSEIELESGRGTARWVDPYVAASQTRTSRLFEVSLETDAKLRFTLVGPEELQQEQAELVGDLCRLIGLRWAERAAQGDT